VSTDIAFQFDILIRLLVAALCGAGLGLEREVHGHQAGMRTHMLVALGSAVFTVMSMYGFPKTPETAFTDPTRISAQIVTGIGFLGAGAIIKYGTNIRGLTTAASLWVVAAVGLSAGAGAYFLAVAGTLIGLLALWPLHVLVGRLGLRGGQLIRLQVELKKLEGFAAVSRVLHEPPCRDRLRFQHQVQVRPSDGAGVAASEPEPDPRLAYRPGKPARPGSEIRHRGRGSLTCLLPGLRGPWR
jgi:uncharacterized membrane protein YhiD involved in acid resistance